MINTYVIGTIRNLVGVALAWALQLPLTGVVLGFLGVDSVTARERATAALTGLLFLVYTGLVRALEQRWPQLAVLLGTPNVVPSYVVRKGITIGPAPDSDNWQGARDNEMGDTLTPG